jgi:vacuolar-type H+-ATPase subunit H
VVEEALRQIKEKEASGTRALEEANKEGAKKIFRAQQKAGELLKEIDLEARKEEEILIKREESSATKEAEKIKEKALQEKARIRKAAKKRMNEAVSFIIRQMSK